MASTWLTIYNPEIRIGYFIVTGSLLPILIVDEIWSRVISSLKGA